MVGSSIVGYTRNVYKKLCDKIGALDKNIKLKRMEPYASTIDKVFSQYNRDDSKKTMMFKLMREPVKGTTQRGKHEANVVEVAGKIADGMDWLNSDITRLMAKHHDTGHTFSGHSGEWWIASIKDTYAMGTYAHNALGARKLMYRNDVETQVEEAIKKEDPNINPRKLAKIKRDLWLVLDGINCHNGEKSEYSYEPDFSKSRARFDEELRGCYVKDGYDRSLVPATAEGSLMRLSDKISYIPFDLVDTFRNGVNIETYTLNGVERNFYDEYRKQFKALGMPDDSLDRLLQCKTEKEYDDFAREIQAILIEDVKKSSKRNNIRMSKDVADTMHRIRDTNNDMMVNYTLTKEDQKVHPQAIENLMNKYANILTSNGLINLKQLDKSAILELKDKPEELEALKKMYAHMPDVVQFINFVSQTSKKDLQFTVDVIDEAFDYTIEEELKFAQSMAVSSVTGVEIEARGDKKDRIDTYIRRFRDDLKVGYENGLFDENSKSPTNTFKKNVWLAKTKSKLKQEIYTFDSAKEACTGVKPPENRVAMEVAAEFLASLNDEQYKQLLLDSKEVDETTMESLTKRYQDRPNFREEAQPHKVWNNLAKLQKEAVQESAGEEEKEKKGFIRRVKERLIGE